MRHVRERRRRNRETDLPGDAVAGGKMKEAGTTYWDPPNTGATNESGLTARPGGYFDGGSDFFHMGSDASFWSSTYADIDRIWAYHLTYDDSLVWRNSGSNYIGLSVRCVMD